MDEEFSWKNKRGKNRIDLTGRSYGTLTVLKFAHRETKGRVTRLFWNCRCACGRLCIKEGACLRHGNTKSCGESFHSHEVRSKALSEANKKHGLSDTPEFRAWAAAKNRCTNPKNPAYKNYGGRGIRMSEEWMQSFETFIREVGFAPTEEHTLERIDVERDYEPGNIVWATMHEQGQNKRNTKLNAEKVRFIRSSTLPKEELAQMFNVRPAQIWKVRKKLQWGNIPDKENMNENLTYSKNGLTLTESFEGCRLVSYQDGVGVWTIGYGHTANVKPGQTITRLQAEAYLLGDLAFAEKSIKHLVTVPLSQDEFDALVDAFVNIGYGNFARSKMLTKLNTGDYKGAADLFEQYDKSGGVVVAGLLRRRVAEEELFEKGIA